MIDVVTHNTVPRRRLPPPAVRRVVRAVLTAERRRKGTVSVVVAGDRLSRRVNRRFLRHDRPTDVISFPLGDGENLEGEIYVNIEKAGRQARVYRVEWEDEIARLIIHGTLHLLGYDDRQPADTRRMKRREDALVVKLAGKDLRPR